MIEPRALRLDWITFDCQSPEVREHLREELERYMAEADMLACRMAFHEPHPNEDYEYQPLVAVIRRRGNY